MLKQRCAAILLALCLSIGQLGCGGLSNSRLGGGRPAPHFKPGFNLFKPEQDIELGRQSAQQVSRQMPVLNDSAIDGYVRQLGAKLAARAPGYKFPYEFHVVGTKDINAFALPGGFVFINAGTIAAAKNEGELAGVMAHEISHVALRHGTNQATKAYIAKTGLGVLSGIAGGTSTDLGQIIGAIGGAGANALFLKFGRTAESQADLEGARIMAEAGYDPRDMANFFKTLAEKGGQRVPEFLSDHPDPGNRYQSVISAIPSLPVSANPTHDTNEFEEVKARLTGSAALGASREPARLGPRDPNDNKSATRPDPPSSSFQEFRSRDGSFALQHPDNWDGLSADEVNLIFAPRGAYGKMDDSIVVTHGIFIGALPPHGDDLRSATVAFVQEQVNSNPDFKVQQGPQEYDFGGRGGFATLVAGPSPVTGVIEVDVIYTTMTSDGRLFYFITIAPEDEYESYKPTFEHIINSIRLAK
ncbi:MAG TPA: M48 family metallopeptidase [Blastocatellia bacterium]|jgi:Zn-dependent protease with chaperone function|nr:M48 family metallopeptidase [Blastocatellia bacterium]